MSYPSHPPSWRPFLARIQLAHSPHTYIFPPRNSSNGPSRQHSHCLEASKDPPQKRLSSIVIGQLIFFPDRNLTELLKMFPPGHGRCPPYATLLMYNIEYVLGLSPAPPFRTPAFCLPLKFTIISFLFSTRSAILIYIDSFFQEVKLKRLPLSSALFQPTTPP